MKTRIYILTALIVSVGAIAGFLYFNNNQPSNSGKDESAVKQSPLEEFNNSQNTTLEEEKLYTMEEVSQHNSKASCWAVIRGVVYDLTQSIDKHPGGPKRILNLCGKDGTQAFERKHGGQERPEQTLEQFKIGILKEL